MSDLFTVENKIRILELKDYDVIKKTDNLRIAQELIKEHQTSYPDIEKWFKTKVMSGIKSNERSMYIGFNNDKPIASAIVKRGDHAKFCHLHIQDELRGQNIGDIFFILMSVFVKRYASDIHFSLPESVWESKREFFKSFGFQNAFKYQTQYRSFETELSATADFNTVWNRVIEKLPKIVERFGDIQDSPLNGIIMSIHPEYSKKILNGEKVVEIRRKFNQKWKNHKVTIYTTSPCKEIVGNATIQNIIEDNPEKVWYKLSDQLGCTKQEFDDYTKGLDKVYAIFLSEVNRYHNPLSLNYLSLFYDKKVSPPQSYSCVQNDKDWSALISIAELLHGRFTTFSQI